MAENRRLIHRDRHRLRQLMAQVPLVEAVKIRHSLLHIFDKARAGNSHVHVYHRVL